MPKLRADAITWREVEGEVVALDLASATYLGINRAGAILFPLLETGTSAEAMAEHLVDRFGIDQRRAAADVEAFVGALAHRGLLEPE